MSENELLLQQIGKRIIERRKKLGLTQEALAEKGDMTTQALIKEINFQKRVEFWGEGIEFLDNRRLNIPLDRTSKDPKNNHFEGARIKLDQESRNFRYQIPIKEIENNKDATAVEQNLMVTLEVCYEFYLRGFHFDTINIYESQATAFKITDNGLLPPFISVRGLGETAAQDTVEKRKGKTFISVEEFSTCCSKLSKTHIEQLKALGAFAGMADTSQITFF